MYLKSPAVASFLVWTFFILRANKKAKPVVDLALVVGAEGFEPPTLCL